MSAEPSGGSLLLSQPVVIDNGTSTIKAGFAGSSTPKVRRSLLVVTVCVYIYIYMAGEFWFTCVLNSYYAMDL